MRVRRVGAWTGVAVALFVFTYCLVLGTRVNLVDESWMLLVTRRLTSDQRLYSDVYFVSTPLAAWVSTGFGFVGGVHLTVLRALEVAVFVVEFLVAVSVARWCRVSWPSLVLFGVAVFVVGTPANAWISVYSSIAVLFALVALRLLLMWYGQRDAAASACAAHVGTRGGGCGMRAVIRVETQRRFARVGCSACRCMGDSR